MSSAPSSLADPGSVEALSARYGERYRWLLLMAVMVGTMASIMSSTVVNVAIPGLSHEFTLSPSRAQWVTSGFMVATTVSMLTTPWLLSRFGYRATYEGCMWLLLAGGLLGGVAQSYPLVLAARVAEGLAAGVVQPIPAIIILRAFQPHEQGRASGLFGMGVVLAPAIGPSIGGVLVDWFGWRSIFFMVAPFCLVSLWMARRFVPSRGPGGAAAVRGDSLDWIGLVLGGAGTLCLLNGLVALRSGPGAQAGLLLGLSAVLFTAFVGWQHRRARAGQAPLMHLALFGNKAFAMGSLVAAIYGMALFGSTYLLPVFMQTGLGISAAHVGTVLLPAGLVLAGSIAVVARWADRHPPSLLVNTGLALLALSFAGIVTVTTSTPILLLTAWCIVGRIGLGFILPSLNLGAMRALDPSLIAHGSSAINFVRTLGGAAGVSLCGVLLEWRLAAHGDGIAAHVVSTQGLAAFDEVFLVLASLCALAMLAGRHLNPQGRPPPRAG